jgi:hypothetical protein
MEKYSQGFFDTRHEKTVYSATTILSILLERMPPIDSAVDVGCGVGTWLSVLQQRGVKDIKGIDGPWVDRSLLAIPQDCFESVDLSKTVRLPRRYDLAISLEVAEHLPSDRAEGFVLLLTELSDFVLFSAAIPFQGGLNHINEQWQDYWVKLFGGLNYVAQDFIRPKIWHDNRIPWWYRQNTLFFAKREKSSHVRLDSVAGDAGVMPLNVVHPDFYLGRIANSQIGVRGSVRLFGRSLRDYLRRKLGRGG